MRDVLKVVELFAGIGTQRMVLKVLDIKHKVVAMSEIDKYAIQSYNLIHGETPNLGDVSKIVPSEVPDCDLLTYSFPCTSCSISGNQEGLQEGSGTASSLLWYCKGIIEAKKPKYLLMENVKNLLGKNHYKYFQEWCDVLESFGYTNYYKVLNAKHYGVPQNRERVFMVSILGEHEPYKFPDLEDVSTCIEDILETNPDKKYYLAEDNKKKFIENLKESGLETALEKINSTEKSTVYTVVMDCCMEMISKTFTTLEQAKLFVEKMIDSYNTYNLPVDRIDGLDYRVEQFMSLLFWLIVKNEFSDEKYKQLQEEILSKYY